MLSVVFFENVERGKSVFKELELAMGGLLLLVDMIFIPIHHENGHWLVAAVFIDAKTLVHLNSIRDMKSSMHVFRVIVAVIEYILEACGKSICFQNWVFISQTLYIVTRWYKVWCIYLCEQL